jgi:hypothetical protein
MSPAKYRKRRRKTATVETFKHLPIFNRIREKVFEVEGKVGGGALPKKRHRAQMTD